jgi:acyl-coenzyme A synthetase/AMP-(fatty) acid ligase
VLCGVASSPDELGRLRVAARDLEAPQRPRRWFVVVDLPLTDAGKLDRDALAARLESGRDVRRTVDAP